MYTFIGCFAVDKQKERNQKNGKHQRVCKDPSKHAAPIERQPAIKVLVEQMIQKRNDKNRDNEKKHAPVTAGLLHPNAICYICPMLI